MHLSAPIKLWLAFRLLYQMKGAGALARTHRRLRPVVHDTAAPDAEALRLTLHAHRAAATNVAEASVRAWWPIAAALLTVVPALRRPILVAISVAALRRGRRPTTVALGLVDDVAYGSGVWLGARRSRSLRALRPVRVG